MSEQKISGRTTLAWGRVRVPVATWKTTGAPDAPKFVQAGPHGAELETGLIKDGRRFVLPEEEQQKFEDQSDPFVVDDAFSTEPDPELPPPPAYESGLLEKGRDEAVSVEDVRRGIRDADGRFIDLTDELLKIGEDTQLDEMRVIGFIARNRLPITRVQGAYYLGADGGGVKALRLLYECVRSGRAALVKWTKTSRQSFGAVIADGRSHDLVVVELAFAEEVRTSPLKARTHLQADVSVMELNAAKLLMRAMEISADELDEISDTRLTLERDLVRRALEGKLEGFALPDRPAAPDPEEAVEDLLRTSV
jgi:non-homologous end joining protein Ku